MLKLLMRNEVSSDLSLKPAWACVRNKFWLVTAKIIALAVTEATSGLSANQLSLANISFAEAAT